jgi:hypothetical protein
MSDYGKFRIPLLGKVDKVPDIGVLSVAHRIKMQDETDWLPRDRKKDGSRKSHENCKMTKEQRKNLVIEHLKKHGDTMLLKNCESFGMSFNHMTTTIKWLKKDGIIESTWHKSNKYFYLKQND